MASRLLAAGAFRMERLLDEHRNIELRSRLGSIGLGSSLARSVHISGAEQVHIGANVHVGRGAWIRGDGGLTVGDNTKVSRNVVIYTSNHQWEGERLPYDDTFVYRPVSIGANVWIGMNVLITPGSVIGEGAIVAMGTTVSGQVPPLSIVASQSARIIGERDPARYEALKAAGRFAGHDGQQLLARLSDP